MASTMNASILLESLIANVANFTRSAAVDRLGGAARRRRGSRNGRVRSRSRCAWSFGHRRAPERSSSAWRRFLAHLFNLVLFATIFSLAGRIQASNISFTYDPAGRLVAADYGGGKSISYVYDNAGSLRQSSGPSLGLAVGTASNNQLTLAWPAAPGGYVLESALSVSPGTVWTSVSIPPTQVGGQMVVTIPLTIQTKFYRLRKL